MKKKTAILDLVSRKLAPFMLLYGFYLLTYGHTSPGGGFQGGVVMASGVILLVVSQGSSATEKYFHEKVLSMVEALAFFAFVAAGISGILLQTGFLGNTFTQVETIPVPRVGMTLVLNLIIGIEVGSGVSLICLRLFRRM